jgi:hypothetical protein
MKKYMLKKLLIVFIFLSVNTAHSTEPEKLPSNTALTTQNKNYGSPIKRWAGDAKCKLKRFFGGNCYK